MIAWLRGALTPGEPKAPSDASALWFLQFAAGHGHSLLGVVFSLDEIFTDGTASLLDAIAADLADVRTAGVSGTILASA